MELNVNIDGRIIDGQAVLYRPGEVIAVGEAARDFIQAMVSCASYEMDRGELLPPAYRLTGLEDSPALVEAARNRGHQVQLNHVLFAHCGDRCDSCCGAHPYGALPYRANPYRANPYRANPYRANAPARTSAVPTTDTAVLSKVVLDNPPQVWILDTGIASNEATTPLDGHGNLDGDRNDVPDQLPPPADGMVDPVAGHGTFIAGIIEQLVPGCALHVKGIIPPGGDISESDVVDAIHDLLANATDPSRTILNLSFGGAVHDPCHDLVGEAIAAAQRAGVVVVASAGNESSCIPPYPANFPGVVSVGAVDKDGQPANFTNVGSWVTACALGVDIVSTFFFFSGEAPDNFAEGWAVWSGTSFAAPVVVAAIAKQISTQGMTAYEALQAVLGEGEPISCLGVRVDTNGFAAELLANAL